MRCAGLGASAGSELSLLNCSVRTDKLRNLMDAFYCKCHLGWVGSAVEQEQVCLEGLCCFIGKCPVQGNWRGCGFWMLLSRNCNNILHPLKWQLIIYFFSSEGLTQWKME